MELLPKWGLWVTHGLFPIALGALPKMLRGFGTVGEPKRNRVGDSSQWKVWRVAEIDVRGLTSFRSHSNKRRDAVIVLFVFYRCEKQRVVGLQKIYAAQVHSTFLPESYYVFSSLGQVF